MTYRLFGLFLLFFSPVVALAAETIFEGYSRVEVSGKQIGYTIQRFEYDSKAKTFTSISFLRAKFGDKIMQESLKAVSNDKFHPIAYQYTGQSGETIKSIDGSFKGEIMKLKISDGKMVRDETHKIPKGTFLSSFLMYMMLQKKLDVNQPPFQFSAIAEEDGASYTGRTWLQSKEDKTGYKVFKVLNKFKGEEFYSRLAAVPDPKEEGRFIKAEILGTNAPTKSITTELVAAPALATEGQVVPNKILVSLFGNMPTGKLNILNDPPGEKKPPIIEPKEEKPAQ